MCGIAGGVGSLPRRSERVRAVVARLEHRGPDDAGYFDDPDCSLGMRRLSIIDLAGGHQPLYNEARNVVCVCNGELYNFQALRHELRSLGHVFATGSDVEVAVHGYESWGDEFVQRVNGMFALALWDSQRRRLVLARDRFGKKPLYYATTDSALVFASELRALLSLSGWSWCVDRDACRAFCLLGYMPADRTPLLNVRRLPPGHIAVWDKAGFTLRRYWTLEPSQVPNGADDAADQLLALFRDAVQLRLLADVPVGAFVSGGLDSSLVVGVAAGLLGARIPTFNMSFPGYTDFDEARYARRLAQYFGCEHHEIAIDASDFHDPAALVWSLDEPLADPAALPTLLLSRAARSRVTVALTGEGADEIFGGYERYSAALLGSALAGRLPLVCRLAAIALRILGDRAADDSKASRLLRAAVYGGTNPVAWSRALAMAPAVALAAGWEQRYLLRLVPSPRLALPVKGGALVALQLDDLEGPLANGLLTKVDRMTMAASLEARCPFLDYRVVNFGLGLADAWKMRGRTGKVILRRVAQRILPKDICQRPKHTFRVPLGPWLRGPLKDVARDASWSPFLSRFGIAPPDRVRSLAEAHIAGRADYSRALWALITLHLWLAEAQRHVGLDGGA